MSTWHFTYPSCSKIANPTAWVDSVGLSLSCHLNGGRGERCFSSVLINFLILASVSENAEPTPEEQDKSLDKPKQKKNRCFMCRKKVGLTGFECRCGNVYCGMHRYSDVHSCSYNYKADAAEKIRKENPVVVGEKIQKIWTAAPAGIQNPLTICRLNWLELFFLSHQECRAVYLA